MCVLIFNLDDGPTAICCVIIIQQIGRLQTGMECFKNYVLLAYYKCTRYLLEFQLWRTYGHDVSKWSAEAVPGLLIIHI